MNTNQWEPLGAMVKTRAKFSREQISELEREYCYHNYLTTPRRLYANIHTLINPGIDFAGVPNK